MIIKQTCPVVNCIYPVHLRVAASESERLNLLEKDEEQGEKDYPSEGEESKNAQSDNIGMIAKGVRLGVIVDRMEHLQGLMDLISCFTPFTSDAKLSVTGKSVSQSVSLSPLLCCFFLSPLLFFLFSSVPLFILSCVLIVPQLSYSLLDPFLSSLLFCF